MAAQVAVWEDNRVLLANGLPLQDLTQDLDDIAIDMLELMFEHEEIEEQLFKEYTKSINALWLRLDKNPQMSNKYLDKYLTKDHVTDARQLQLLHKLAVAVDLSIEATKEFKKLQRKRQQQGKPKPNRTEFIMARVFPRDLGPQLVQFLFDFYDSFTFYERPDGYWECTGKPAKTWCQWSRAKARRLRALDAEIAALAREQEDNERAGGVEQKARDAQERGELAAWRAEHSSKRESLFPRVLDLPKKAKWFTVFGVAENFVKPNLADYGLQRQHINRTYRAMTLAYHPDKTSKYPSIKEYLQKRWDLIAESRTKALLEISEAEAESNHVQLHDVVDVDEED